MDQSAHDADRMVARRNAAGDLPTKLLGRDFWKGAYKPDYAWGKIVVRGKHVLPSLYAIAMDPTQSRDNRVSAWNFIGSLNGFDRPGAIESLLTQCRQSLLDRDSCYWIFYSAFPIDRWADVPPLGQAGVSEWLDGQLRTNSYDEFILGLLDDLMNPRRFDMPSNFRFFRRFLNRYNDRDLDEWLKSKSLVAFRFRQNEIEKGYDPADELIEYLSQFVSWNELDDALRAIYPDPMDQEGCKELMRAMTHSDLKEIEEEVGWESRLREWYRANRSRFVYDRRMHRFVVGERVSQGVESNSGGRS